MANKEKRKELFATNPSIGQGITESLQEVLDIQKGKKKHPVTAR
tara:strand:+ start:118 stop:249 length:132 start_codon:yes stop_codon:yes gene_type:complete